MRPNPAPSRRRFIALVGGGAVLAAAPLAGCSDTYPAAAVRAWEPVPPDTEVRRWMLAHALLAPNPHNRQPWRADLRRDGEITLVCDAERLLPETDPFGRQILIGCGAFVELAVIAAAERGVRVDLQAFPDGEPGLRELPGGRAVARLVLKPDAGVARDPLFAQIRRRHTHKGEYDSTRAVAAADWAALAARAAERGLQAGAVVEPQRLAELRALTREAYRIELTTERTYLESAHLMRIGSAEIERHRDGISITGTVPVLASALGLFDRFEVPRAGSKNFQRVMERWAPFETGSGYFWLAGRGNARRVQFDSGRAWVRAHLQATALGLEMHPLSQALQEFAEMRGPYDALHRALGFDPAADTVQMFGRVGFAKAPWSGTPRRPLDDLVSTRA